MLVHNLLAPHGCLQPAHVLSGPCDPLVAGIVGTLGQVDQHVQPTSALESKLFGAYQDLNMVVSLASYDKIPLAIVETTTKTAAAMTMVPEKNQEAQGVVSRCQAV